jgi:hypothetical protein
MFNTFPHFRKIKMWKMCLRNEKNTLTKHNNSEWMKAAVKQTAKFCPAQNTKREYSKTGTA